MIEITQAVPGHTAVIRVPETEEELPQFWEWLNSQKGQRLAVDTETTGLDIFSPGFRVRTIQVGVGLEAWVIPVEELSIGPQEVEKMLVDRELILQNAAYDLLAIRRFFGVKLDWDRIEDTYILASIHDPRSVQEGGHGKTLEDLTRAFIDPEIADSVKKSMATLSKELSLIHI